MWSGCARKSERNGTARVQTTSPKVLNDASRYSTGSGRNAASQAHGERYQGPGANPLVGGFTRRQYRAEELTGAVPPDAPVATVVVGPVMSCPPFPPRSRHHAGGAVARRSVSGQ